MFGPATSQTATSKFYGSSRAVVVFFCSSNLVGGPLQLFRLFRVNLIYYTDFWGLLYTSTL